eukprot:6263768-Amphidinium_carterae.1
MRSLTVPCALHAVDNGCMAVKLLESLATLRVPDLRARQEQHCTRNGIIFRAVLPLLSIKDEQTSP